MTNCAPAIKAQERDPSRLQHIPLHNVQKCFQLRKYQHAVARALCRFLLLLDIRVSIADDAALLCSR